MAAGPSLSTVRWMSYLTENGILDVDDSPANFLLPGQQAGTDCSADDIGCKVDETDESNREASGSRKRQREDGSKEGTSKANREKMRRDRLNDRFVELSRALEDGKPPKTDKATILCDAVRVIGQLRQEAVALKEGNTQLKEQIKELKAEKNELRDEKARLKAEKERLEQQVKSMTFQQGFVPHTAAMQAAAAAFAAQAQVQAPLPMKLATPAPATPVAMWQWLPPASVDTSQDHVLRPPVA